MNRICQNCGNEFIIRKPSILKHRPAMFCSRQCYYVSLKGRDITWGDKITKSLLGKKLTPEHRQHLRENHVGTTGYKKANPTTPINNLIRKSKEYADWRMAVFITDNFACVLCGSRNNIQADHIKQFAYFPELRFDIDNGRTLCFECHLKTPTYGSRRLVCA